MRKKRRISGFTMVEMLIVVAIIAVLGGVSFVAIQNHSRRMARLELDAIAKEIFVSAQNHLTMADTQSYLGSTSFGNPVSGEKNTYYLVKGDSTSAAMLDILLPFGAVDENVRAGGSYIIRYSSNPAAVLDVFYCATSGNYSHTLAVGEYDTVKAMCGEAKAKSDERLKFGSAVLGWYGGNVDLEIGDALDPPEIEVINAERLIVKVKNTNSAKNTDLNAANETASLKLIITGVTSGAQAAVSLHATPSGSNYLRYQMPDGNNVYTVVLDDITERGMQFSKLEATGTFLPGEDIIVQAVAFSNTALTNIAYSGEITTNSLFADLDDGLETAMIGNIRHLENLDERVSGVTYNGTDVKITKAAQIVDLNKFEASADPDLDWPGFADAIRKAKNSTDKIHVFYSGSSQTKDDCYLPVSPGYALSYDGQGHSISGIKVDAAGNAGLFGTLNSGEIENLELIDFSVKGQKAEGATDAVNAGALAGALDGTTVTNVVAYNSTDHRTPEDVTADGSAGGLIGAVTGASAIQRCAAALTVKSSAGDAGGLIGTITGTGATVSASYSGGHTKDAGYYDGDDPICNVTGAASGASAGGLIGGAGGATVQNCYSTCSVSGATAGGLIGVASGSVENGYATGLVTGTTKGAFIGKLETGGAVDDCQYFEMVNGDLKALSTGDNAEITALDKDAASYNAFVGAPDGWQPAKVYDATLTTYYGTDKYSLRPMSTLAGTSLEAGDFVATHHGDWPAPETMIMNEAASSGD